MLAATILASGTAFLGGTVVNVALPRIEQDLGAWLTMTGIPNAPGIRSDLTMRPPILGGLLAVTGLAPLVGSPIETSPVGWPVATAGGLLGILVLVGFIVGERRCR